MDSNRRDVYLTKSPPIFIPDSFEGYPISSFCLQHVPAEDLDSVLIPGGLVRDRIERLAMDISSDLGKEEYIFLCVLKGGFQFFNQLLEVVRQYHRFNADQSLEGIKAGKARRIQAEFIRLVSYEDDASVGSVKIIGMENLASLSDMNIIIVEDIIDTGLTMTTLLSALEKFRPKTVRVASLFFKRTPKNTINYKPDYMGFSIPDSFIVGCNLDYNNYFRDLQHVCVISNHVEDKSTELDKMESMKAKLQKLKEQRKQASHANFKEVLEENERSKRPANWDKRLERYAEKLKEEDAKQEAERSGQNYELKKSLNIQANELERWDRLTASRKRPDPGFVDFETATKRQYGRLVKQIKPDLEEYNSLKEEMGEELFYLKNKDAIPKASLVKDSKEGVDRLVEDVNKQIEVRSKRSRRRRFDDEADVDYINERNMKFNKKLERFYGNYTEEIKQNFERGTAL